MNAGSLPRGKGFRLIATTADMGFIAYGRTPAELFSHAAQALAAITTDPGKIRAEEERTVSVSGGDREELLLNWLNELLYLREVREYLGKEFLVEEVDDRRLRVRIRGEQWDPRRHRLRREVKAVTYHRLKIRCQDTGWEAEVIVDL